MWNSLSFFSVSQASEGQRVPGVDCETQATGYLFSAFLRRACLCSPKKRENVTPVMSPQHGVATYYFNLPNQINIKVPLTLSFIEQKEKEVIFLTAQRTICQKTAQPSIPLQPASSGRKYTPIILFFSLAFYFNFI